MKESKSKTWAMIMAFILGGVGLHKFYLGRITAGIFYLLFSWTGIPVILGFIDFIIIAAMTDEKFDNLYNS